MVGGMKEMCVNDKRNFYIWSYDTE